MTRAKFFELTTVEFDHETITDRDLLSDARCRSQNRASIAVELGVMSALEPKAYGSSSFEFYARFSA
jgi:hypothetical protein